MPKAKPVQEILDQRGKPRVRTINEEPSKTVQSDRHLADITNILKSFGVEGNDILDNIDLVFADVSELGDFTDVMLTVKEAEAKFLELPSKVRELFGHDVAVFLDTAHDKDKRDAMVEAGFLEAPEVPVVVPDVTPEPTADDAAE